MVLKFKGRAWAWNAENRNDQRDRNPQADPLFLVCSGIAISLCLIFLLARPAWLPVEKTGTIQWVRPAVIDGADCKLGHTRALPYMVEVMPSSSTQQYLIEGSLQISLAQTTRGLNEVA